MAVCSKKKPKNINQTQKTQARLPERLDRLFEVCFYIFRFVWCRRNHKQNQQTRQRRCLRGIRFPVIKCCDLPLFPWKTRLCHLATQSRVEEPE